MKKLTNLAVVSVMDLLIHTNGQTTTLEIKNQLRELDYQASQNDVHRIVESIFDSDTDDKYERDAINSQYNVYKFTEEFIADNDEFAAPAIVQDATLTGTPAFTQKKQSVAVVTSNQTLNTPTTSNTPFSTKQSVLNTPAINVVQPVIQTVSREPLFIFYTENHARKSGSDEQNWVVFHKDDTREIQIFDKALTSDLVRSRYASILKFKIQDVRARRFKNY